MEELRVARVAIVAGARTPSVKVGTLFKHHLALAPGLHSVRGLLEKHP